MEVDRRPSRRDGSFPKPIFHFHDYPIVGKRAISLQGLQKHSRRVPFLAKDPLWSSMIFSRDYLDQDPQSLRSEHVPGLLARDYQTSCDRLYHTSRIDIFGWMSRCNLRGAMLLPFCRAFRSRAVCQAKSLSQKVSQMAQEVVDI